MIGFSEDPKWLFDSDWFKILNTLILGLGNGLCGTLLMIMGPYKVSSADSERAGQIMAFHMTLGRGLGSMVGVIGFYQVFKEIQDAFKNSIMKGKFNNTLVY
jgi:ABC-type bacteriocin/lantibiotic exporter with double-glycine peptidase domain